MSARTTQERLDAVDTLIAKYEAEPMEEFWTGLERRYRRAKLLELYAERKRLQERLDAESGTRFFLAEPFTQ